jgi:tetratricopeptide (TPR) repeat protein
VLRSEKLAALKPGDLGARKVLATSLLTEARVKGSLTRWRQALDAHESLLAAHSDPELLRNTALIHKYLSGWYLSTDEVQKRDYQKALEHALKAAEIDEKRLAADPQHPQTQLDLAIDLSQVGSSYEALGDLRNAFVHMQRSAGIRERVVQANPDDARARDRLAWALNQQAYYRRRLGDPTRALADFRRVISIYEGLYARKAINDQMVSGYAYSHFEVGDLLKQAGKPADACTHYLKSVHLYAEREKMRSFSVFELQNVKLARAAAAACAAR